MKIIFILTVATFGVPGSIQQGFRSDNENGNHILIGENSASSSEDVIQVSIKPQEGRQLFDELLSEAIRGFAKTPGRGNVHSSEETDRRNSFNLQGLEREKILRILSEAKNLGEAIPSNRESISEEGLERRIDDLSRRIILNYNRLPGVYQPDGTRCIEKVVLVEETDYDRGMECSHRLKKKCHLTYITDYHSSPEEKCEASFKKNCHISFKPVAHRAKVKRCHIPYIKKCGENVTGPEVCSTRYENHCKTTYKTYDIHQDEPLCQMVEELKCQKVPVPLLHLPQKEPFAIKEKCEKWPVKKCRLEQRDVRKIHPQTECKKIPREICSPSNCETLPGEEICEEETRTQIQNMPQEECDIQPLEHCRTYSTLVPRLVPKKNCVKVPKEVCVNTKSNPKKVKTPVLKNWCYDPRELKKAILDEL